MKGKFYWHVHHDVLLERSDDIEKRVAYIKREKRAKEIPLRLKLLKPVRGKLPDKVVGAWAACNEATAAYYKAAAASNEAWATCDKAWAAYRKAEAACNEAWTACDKAWAAYRKALADHKAEIEALHRRECPDCPWNGKTIFPGKEGEG